MRADLMRQQSEQEFSDWDLAKKLQKAEIVAHKRSRQTASGAQPSPTQSLPSSFHHTGIMSPSLSVSCWVELTL
jgi:hypothetical protein